MGTITDQAAAMVDLLEAADINATANIRKVRPPGVLVVPVPNYDFTEGTLAGGYTLTWTLWALAPGVGDLKAAGVLENLVAVCVEVLDIETAVADAYKLPGATDPLPAYKLTATDIT